MVSLVASGGIVCRLKALCAAASKVSSRPRLCENAGVFQNGRTILYVADIHVCWMTMTMLSECLFQRCPWRSKGDPSPAVAFSHSLDPSATIERSACWQPDRPRTTGHNRERNSCLRLIGTVNWTLSLHCFRIGIVRENHDELGQTAYPAA
jgi:hypothetical protein